jgi:DNA primase
MAGVDFNAVRAAVTLQQVLDLLDFVPVCREGDQLRGPCPIHRSKSARSRSFSANLRLNAFRCFTCGAQGNQLDLCARSQSLTLFDAALDLSRRLNVQALSVGMSAVAKSEKRNP